MRLNRLNTWNGVPLGGFQLRQGGTIGLRGIPLTDKDVVGGLPILNGNGDVRLGDIPQSLLDYRPTLEGIRSVRINTPLNFHITNFGYNRDYNLSFPNGSISRVHDIVTVIPFEIDEQTFFINDRPFTINVIDARVRAPTITSVSQVDTPTFQLNVQTSAFATDIDPDVHVGTEWQLSLDPNFGSILATSLDTTAPLTSHTITPPTKRSRFYLRARHQGQDMGFSSWSPIVEYVTMNFLEGINDNDQYGSALAISGLGQKVIVGSPGYSGLGQINNGLVTLLRDTGAGYTEEGIFGHLNVPSSVTLNIPAGGQIQILLDSNTPYDQTFTSSQVVNLPAWNTVATIRGRGGPGFQTWVEPVPEVPQQGDPLYPAGLPPYDEDNGIGSPLYPSGLPPYSPAVPEVPGYFEDQPGESSTLVFGSTTLTFAGGMGNVPAVTVEQRFYANNMDAFGKAVAISNDSSCFIAGAPNDRVGTLSNAGSCFVSYFQSGQWGNLLRLAPPVPAAQARFGAAVATNVDGTVHFVGAPGENRVYVYKANTLAATISVPALISNEEFGAAISCSSSGNRVAISAFQENTGAISGKVYVFQETSPNVWALQHSFVPNITPALSSVVPDSMELVVEQRNSAGGLISSQVFDGTLTIDPLAMTLRLMSRRVGDPINTGITGAFEDQPLYPEGIWGFQDQQNPTGGMEHAEFMGGGFLPGQAFTATIYGKDYAFAASGGVGGITTTHEIVVVRGLNNFGRSISLSANGLHLAVGVPNTTIINNDQGMVFLYRLNMGGDELRLIGPSPIGGFRYGLAVAYNQDGTKLIVSEPRRNSNLGSYDVWTINHITQTLSRLTSTPDATEQTMAFGTSAAMAANGAVFAFGDPVANINRGKIYLGN